MTVTRSLAGKVVAITGGARGIGEATARALADAGAKVVIGDLDLDVAEVSAKAYGGLALPLDVSDSDSFAAFLDGVLAERGRLDALVNNAGFMVLGKVEDVPLARQLSQINVNLTGVIIGSREAAARMSSGGVIVNIASLAGRVMLPGSAVYNATKAGVLAFTESLDAELADRGIRAVSILPSFTNTGLIAGTEGTSVFTKPIEPEDVAASVLATIIKPKATRVVPKMFTLSAHTWSITTSRAKPALRRRFGLDHVFTEIDETKRADYINRNEH